MTGSEIATRPLNERESERAIEDEPTNSPSTTAAGTGPFSRQSLVVSVGTDEEGVTKMRSIKAEHSAVGTTADSGRRHYKKLWLHG